MPKPKNPRGRVIIIKGGKEIGVDNEVLNVINWYINSMARINNKAKCWYFGITHNLDERLAAHKVHPDSCLKAKMSSEAYARYVEDHFVRTVGTRGDSGGGTGLGDCVYTYAYQVTSQTIQ